MDVFEVREQLINDYRAFTAAFVEPRDVRIRAFIAEQLAEGAQWPDPWLSLNPNFDGGGTVTELADQGVLHAECDRIFRVKEHPNDPGRRPIRFHRHQTDAIRAAASGKSYVLTTGTGSGKSLGLHRPDRRRCAARPGRERRQAPTGREGDRRLPDERAGQLPGRRAGEVPPLRLPRGRGAGHLRPLHRPGEPGRAAADPRRARRTSC